MSSKGSSSKDILSQENYDIEGGDQSGADYSDKGRYGNDDKIVNIEDQEEIENNRPRNLIQKNREMSGAFGTLGDSSRQQMRDQKSGEG